MKATIDVREMPSVISDSGRVRIGDVTLLFPALVRSRPSNASDSGKVRIGDVSPAFPPLRSR